MERILRQVSKTYVAHESMKNTISIQSNLRHYQHTLSLRHRHELKAPHDARRSWLDRIPQIIIIRNTLLSYVIGNAHYV